jgi:hypothetical protein
MRAIEKLKSSVSTLDFFYLKSDFGLVNDVAKLTFLVIDNVMTNINNLYRITKRSVKELNI